MGKWIAKVVEAVVWVIGWGTLLVFFWFLLDFDMLVR